MHCPSCGQSATEGQQFCRNCGMGLEAVGKLVAQHSPSPAAGERRLRKAEAEPAVVRRMTRWMLWGLLVMAIGVVMLVTNKSFDLGRWFGLLTSLFILAGVGMAAYAVLGAVRDGASPVEKVSLAEVPSS